MIEPVTQSRWHDAQAAEATVVNYDLESSRRAAEHVFSYLGIELDQQGKVIAEVGSGPYPAVGFCGNADGWAFEPLWFQSLEDLKSKAEIYWIREPFEDAEISAVYFHEVWLFNVLQHVRDPELVISKAKETANVIRFFEPVDYPICVYHPHTFTEQDFIRWFGDSVKRYTDRLPGFFDGDCCYGTWRRE